MACFVSAEPFLKKAIQFPWGIKSCPIQEESSKDGEPGALHDQPVEGSQIALSARDFNMGPGVGTLVYVTTAKSFSESWVSSVKALGQICNFPWATEQSSRCSSFSGVMALGGDTKFQKVRPPSHQRRLFHIVFNRTNIWALPALFFSAFLLDSRSIKSERTMKTSPWETEKTKTALTTWQVSRPWLTQGQLRLQRERRCPRGCCGTTLRLDGWTSAKRTLPSLVCVAWPPPCSSWCRRWFRRRARTLAVEAGGSALPLRRGGEKHLANAKGRYISTCQTHLAHALNPLFSGFL